MTIKKTIEGDIKTVEHVLRKVSAICLIFIRHGGNIVCLAYMALIDTCLICHKVYLKYWIMKSIRSDLNEAGKMRRQLEFTLHIIMYFLVCWYYNALKRSYFINGEQPIAK